MHTSIGMTGTSPTKLTQLRELLSTIRGPVLMVGDWNMEPAELGQSGALAAFLPQHCLSARTGPGASTCAVGGRRLLDFPLVNQPAALLMGEV